jgi:hypothetical protein
VSELTPRNNFPYPTERQEPFYDTAKGNYLAEDAAMWANAENGNLTYVGGGIFNLDAGTNILWWTQNINVTGFSTPFKAVISGPASVEIQDGEVVYYKMLRLIQNADVSIAALYRSNRIYLEGVRMHDLRLFCYRSGTTLYFADGKSLKDGETGPLFGTGIGVPPSTYVPHRHAPAALVTPPPATTVLTPAPLYIAPELVRIDLFKNGAHLIEGIDYSVNLVAGTATVAVPSVLNDRFTFFRELRDFPASYTTHEHSVKLILTPAPATALLNVLATSPSLTRVDVFKNGQLLVEGAPYDYTINLATGIVTLTTASVFGDRFEVWRELAI